MFQLAIELLEPRSNLNPPEGVLHPWNTFRKLDAFIWNVLLILIGLYVEKKNVLVSLAEDGWVRPKAVHHGWTEHRSGHSSRLHRRRVSTRFEMKGGSQGMLARLVANGGQKSKQKQSYRHSKSHQSSLQSAGEKQTRRNMTSHTASSSRTVGQTR